MRLPCAALLIASAAAAAPLAAQALGVAASTLSSIRVTGDARVSAKPDRVQIDLGVQTQAPQSQDAASANARQLDAVLAAVRRAAGPGAQIKTVSYSLSPNYQYHSGGGEPTISGYTALNVVQIQLDELARIGDVLDAATRAGANRVQGIQWTLRDQDAVRAEALREAATRAHAEAEVLAGALNLRILRVLTVEESSPQIVPVR
ncbi:MAG TPA: SIMPL domain-containing protein, partial [Steroidobacteraceae bacterium]|nr:SIMPL domain-containing protein [Steroidobacteraceae bacterium]